ncbi:hypothetical protein Phi18:3_gp035 [Cellulophaga phage phi18:3]|uniref:Uncharacterized protein n=1 Tax=Cellulophaga phage phi18:3 TaxID=1327983 RepID=S0A265_9CAUD|nr:hypothetical protein Phi18:3_gp035 [Cellulophaga phage phi18:3]AGO48547.1 hypothetical protein Phi18:3_gp035 [Cellulophaga phage phi18:3]
MLGTFKIMRFITIVGIIAISKCINNEMFLKMFEDSSNAIAIAAVIALIMDLVEFAKKMDT